MDEAVTWRHMKGAPKDGTRVLVTVRSSEQGPAEVDVAYWARADQYGIEGWRSADSHPGQIVAYADPELKCWMPLPGAGSAAHARALECRKRRGTVRLWHLTFRLLPTVAKISLALNRSGSTRRDVDRYRACLYRHWV